MPTWSTRTRVDDQRKDHIDSEGPLQGNSPKQLQTQNLRNDDVENINNTNKGRDLLLTYKLRIVLRGTEMIPQKIRRQRGVTKWHMI